MTHYARLATVAIALSLPVACDKASDDLVKTTGAEVKANDEIRSANEKAAREDQAARESEDRTIAIADANFAKLRADYRAQTRKSLADLDSNVSALEARSTKGVDARLQELHAKRAEFDTDAAALDSAGESTWDAQRAALDKKLSAMILLADRANASSDSNGRRY
jgi:hypothetical protein